MRKNLIIKISLLLLALITGLVQADWSTDPNVNTPVCVAPGDQDQPQAVSVGKGATVISSIDQNQTFYVQKMDARGRQQWGTGGVRVVDATDALMVPDGKGGVIIAYSDNSKLFVQIIDSLGQRQLGTNGRQLQVGDFPGYRAISVGFMIEASTSGIFLLYYGQKISDNQNEYYLLYLDRSGNMNWVKGPFGVELEDLIPHLIADGRGGAWLLSDNRHLIKYRHASSNGELTPANGFAQIDADPDGAVYPKAVADANGGLLLVYLSHREQSGQKYWYLNGQRIGSDGNHQWPVAGVPLVPINASRTLPKGENSQFVVAPAADGGVVAFWYEQGLPQFHNRYLRGQYLNNSGNRIWGDAGYSWQVGSDLPHNLNSLIDFALLHAPLNNLLLTYWLYPEDGGPKLYVKKMKLDQTSDWTSDKLVCSNPAAAITTPAWYKQLLINSDGQSGAVVTWVDQRNGNRDLFAQNIRANGALGLPAPPLPTTVPKFAWVKQFGSAGAESGRIVSRDRTGNFVVAGEFSGSLDFGGVTLPASGGHFIAKIDAPGNVVWVTTIRGARNLSDVACDPAGNLFAWGNLQIGRTMYFDDDSLRHPGGSSESGVFLIKYNPRGKSLWAIMGRGQDVVVAASIATDEAGNCLVSGYCEGLTLGNIGWWLGMNISPFIIKIDPQGNTLWGRTYAYREPSFGVKYDVSTDGFGNSYTAGSALGRTQNNIVEIAVISKFSAAGDTVWSRRIWGDTEVRPRSIATDWDGNSVVVGHYKGSVTFGATKLTSYANNDAFIVKYDPQGNVLWARSSQAHLYARALAVSINPQREIMLTGYFNGTLVLGDTTLDNTLGSDLFIASYDPNGNFRWAKQTTGDGETAGDALVTDAEGGCLITGNFERSVRFDDQDLTSVGNKDLYIAYLGTEKPGRRPGVLHVPAEYATIQMAIDAAIERDTILVAPGTYNLSTTILNDRVDHLTLKGSRRADGSNASIIQASVNPGTYVGILFKNVQYGIISGFEVRYAHSGISVDYCKFCEISHNYVHDNDQAISFHGNGIEVFHSEDIGVYFNIIDNHEYHGIDVGDGNKNVTIQNNTVLRTFRYDGICVSGPYVENITIKNNIIAFSAQEGIALITHNPPSPVNFVNDYNCFWQNGYGPIEAGYTIGPHSLQMDPQLVDFAHHNYYLQPTSPCLGAGEGGVLIGALGTQFPVGTIIPIGEILLPLPVGGVKVRAMGENVCCTDYNGKLVMVDVANPAQPRLRGQIEDLPGSNIHELWCTGNYAFTAHRYGGINLINVANPDAPQVLTTAPTNYCHAGLYSVGNYLYYGEHCVGGAPGGLRIYDFSQATLNQTGTWFGEIDGRRLIVTRDGKYVYQTTSRDMWPPAKMVIYDASDKASPQLVNTFNAGYHAKGLALSADEKYLYLNTSYDWNTAPTGLQIWDLTQRANPQLVTCFNLVKGGLLAYDPIEQVLFTTTERGTLYALDVARPDQITVLDSVAGHGLGWLDFQRGYLYVGSAGPNDLPPYYLKIFKFTRRQPTGFTLPVTDVPAEFMLSQNYPNPFNPACHLRYQLPVTSKVQVTIYNLLGQAIRTLVNADQAAGYYHILWDGTDQMGQPMTSGIYYCQIQAGAFRQTRKLILLR